MSMRRLCAALVTGLLLGSAAGYAQVVPLQAGMRISPDSVTVGDPFTVLVRIRAPRGAIIEFPVAPDTAGGIGVLAAVAVSETADTLALDQTATYRLAAWDVGELALRFPDATVREGDAVRRVPLAAQRVRVASVLPADSSLHVPKPARDVFSPRLPWWWWLVALAALAAVAALIYWWWRRRHKPLPAAASDPYEQAQGEFARIEAMGLIAAGELGHYTALTADVMRAYLGRVRPEATESLTSNELLHVLRAANEVPHARLATLLQQVDLVKFASARVDVARATSYGREAKAIVQAVHVARSSPPASLQEAA